MCEYLVMYKGILFSFHLPYLSILMQTCYIIRITGVAIKQWKSIDD